MASPHVNILRDGEEVRFVIYKGIKLIKTNDGLRLLDVRYNDYYTRVSKYDKRLLRKYGFVEGCDRIMHRRDVMRSTYYNNLLAQMYSTKYGYKKELGGLDIKSTDPKEREEVRMLKKKLGVLTRKIQEVMDTHLFYEARRLQFENKNKV